MQKYCFLLLLILSFCSSIVYGDKKVQTALTPVVGYRQDNVRWTLSNGSSGRWKNLKFLDYGIKGDTTFKKCYALFYDLTIANVVNGTYHDNHYLNPNRSSSITAKNVSSIAIRPNIGIGDKIAIKKYLSLVPQIGFIYDLLYLKTKTQNFGSVSNFTDTIQWYGPWFGVDAIAKLTRRWELILGGTYNLVFYNNSGTWELPPSQLQNKMSQHGTGQAFKGRMRISYEVVKSVSLGGEADIGWQWLSKGHEQRNFATSPTVKNKLKKVTANSFGARLTLTKSFQ